MADFIFQNKKIANTWYNTSNYIIILSVKDESELTAVYREAQGLNIYSTAFTEPDIGNEITAIAMYGNDVELYCNNLELALCKKDMLNSELVKEQYKNTRRKLNKSRRKLNSICVNIKDKGNI